MSAQSMKIRKLKGKDNKVLGRIVGKVAQKVDIKGIFSGDEDKAGEVMVRIMALVISEQDEELYPFLADLAGMTEEELDEGDFCLPMDIAKALIASEDGKRFLERAFS